jgi:TolB protein
MPGDDTGRQDRKEDPGREVHVLAHFKRDNILTTLLLATALVLALFQTAGAPEVRFSITKGFGEKIIVAVPLFEGPATGMANAPAVRELLSADLERSGHFSIVENTEFVDEVEIDDRRMQMVNFPEWLALGGEVLVKGTLEVELTSFTIEATIYDLAQGARIFRKPYVGDQKEWRRAVHALADDIVSQLTGEAGIAQSRIAFVSNAPGLKQIYVMDYDGENRTRLTNSNHMSMYPDWFPDGKQVVYTQFYASRQETQRVPASAGQPTRITSFPGLNAFAAVSDRGAEMLMTLSKDGNPEIYRLRVDGTEPRRLTFNRSTESSPCWSPDGRRIAFVSDRAGAPQIYIMSAGGGSAERATYRGGYNSSPDWSPKGDLIAYTSRIDGVFQICTVDVDTKEVMRLTQGSGQKEDPSWAPDGRHLVYSEKSGGKSDLFMVDIYEQEPIRLTSGAGDYLSPAWSP